MSFELHRSRPIPGIQASFEEYEHQTGMRHVHVKRDDNERGFMLLFPTPPNNDRGIPHILEHLALAGSEQFPIRNPFFSMLRRSTASFINAMTASTFTMYPFSTTNESDYWNLMSVYSDATFFPNLDRLDFMQEGWRDTLDENGNLAIAGVVYNEMLGALNSRDDRLEIEIDRLWSAGHPEAFVSGGEPLAIPSLSHEELVQFHKEHYHPSRAVLLTYGNFDAALAQEKIEEMVLSRREWEKFPPIVHAPRIAPATKMAVVSVPQEGDDNEHSLTFQWKLDNADPVDRAMISAMNKLVLSPGGPLNELLEEADFCRPGAVVFVNQDDHALLRIALEGLAEEDIERGKELVSQAIALAIAEEHSAEHVQSILRDFEFSERSPGGKIFGMPFCIGKMYLASRHLLAGHDAISAFDNGETLEALHNRLVQPGAISQWLRDNIDRPADLVVHGKPDPEFSARYAESLAAVAASHQDALTDDRRAQIVRDNEALAARQATPSDLSILPGLTVSDLSALPRQFIPLDFVAGTASSPAELGVEIASNGQVHLGVSVDISHVPHEDYPFVDLLVDLTTQLGSGNKGWSEAMRSREISCVAASSKVNTIARVDDQSAFGVEAVFETVGLVRDIPAMCEVMREMISDVKTDERDRIRQVLNHSLDAVNQDISQHGNEWAVAEMMRSVSPLAAFRAQFSGRNAHAWLADVCERLDDPDRAQEVFDRLARAKSYLAQSPIVLRAACEQPQAALDAMREVFDRSPGWTTPQGSQAMTYTQPEAADVALSGKSSVQYMHQAWKTPNMAHPGTGYLAVLSQVMSMDFLHQAVREKGGAYGAGAKYDQSGTFSLMSYRDPRLTGTLSDFEASTQWAMSGQVDQDMVNSAIIAVCRSLDAPTALSTAAQESWVNLRSGVSMEDRERFRAEVLGATVADIQEAARTVFSNPPVARAGFIGEAMVDEARGNGFEVRSLSKPKETVSVSAKSSRPR